MPGFAGAYAMMGDVNTNLFVHSLPPLHISTYTQHTYTHTWLYTQSGETALYIAVREEHEDIVDQLLEANADPDLPLKVIHTHLTWQSCYMWTVPNKINTVVYTVYCCTCYLFWWSGCGLSHVSTRQEDQDLNLLVISSYYYPPNITLTDIIHTKYTDFSHLKPSSHSNSKT